ncbi:hypothetical protein GGR53DRAFT_528347, partial [Hypoxylon sp. FL1150]
MGSTLDHTLSVVKRLHLLDRPKDFSDITEVNAAPVFTEPARKGAANLGTPSTPSFSQYGLIAGISHAGSPRADDMLYYNVATPSSTFICGSQGSGKSHTLSCLLENCLFHSDANELRKPLTGIVFHYDTFISDSGGSPCEAAFLSTHPGTSVRVLCAPTNVAVIRKVYSSLPNVQIEELRINETDLNTKRMMDLMAVKEGGAKPLYLHVIDRMLRDLRLEQQKTGSSFQYAAFKEMIDSELLAPGQRGPLSQRLDTLESFMVEEQAWPGQTSTYSSKAPPTKTAGIDWKPKPGQLTIVDLSCPCVTAETACSLFDICLALFLEQDHSIGRVVALDEAHKYMNESAEAGALTEQLLTTIRVQRHAGARIIISTQEPTISPKLLDLCSVTIVHRFTSPDWLLSLQRHLAGMSIVRRLREKTAEADDEMGQLADGVQTLSIEESDPAADMFSHIVGLKVGEALLFAPSAAGIGIV